MSACRDGKPTNPCLVAANHLLGMTVDRWGPVAMLEITAGQRSICVLHDSPVVADDELQHAST